MKNDFARLLFRWNKKHNQRQMPWKGEKNPYYIWLSEIILQQTRVEQGLPYFLRFREKYPTVKHLAQAKEDDVLKLWQGLGYYSRARNLHETARNIQGNYQGKFPRQYEELKKLKGVGEYTASAIASFAFGERKAVVDGNVIRVLARVFGIEAAFYSTEGKKSFAKLAQELIENSQDPGVYNQSIMDFGSMVCAPQNPQCPECVFKSGCLAYNTNRVTELPVREKKPKMMSRFFNYLVIKNENEIFVRKRTGNDIWKNLYELPLIETKKPATKNISAEISKLLNTNDFSIAVFSKATIQMLSHRKIHFRFIHINLENLQDFKLPGARQVKLKSVHKLAFPKTVYLYLEENCLL